MTKYQEIAKAPKGMSLDGCARVSEEQGANQLAAKPCAQRQVVRMQPFLEHGH